MEFCQERRLIEPEDQKQLFDQYNHAWNTLGALIRSLKDKKSDASWDDTYNVVKEELEDYDF